MAVPAALIPPSPLVPPPPISTPSATTSPPSTTSSPSPSLAPPSGPGQTLFRSELLATSSPGIPTAALPPSKPVYSTPSPVENIPQNNECKMVELRGAKVASFTVDGCELICLPQAFDLFLKHLVGGLHTVYTKLKRLEITPVVCNVEQVRILRGLGAIQPGVNRCKLISRKDFETLYNDCTNASSRPGRPPKRTQSVTSPENPHIMPHSVPGLMSPGMIPPTACSCELQCSRAKVREHQKAPLRHSFEQHLICEGNLSHKQPRVSVLRCDEMLVCMVMNSLPLAFEAIHHNGLSMNHALLGLSPNIPPGPKEGDLAHDMSHEAATHKRIHADKAQPEQCVAKVQPEFFSTEKSPHWSHSLTPEMESDRSSGRTDAERTIQDGRLFLKTTVMY
ncbi:hypothetical protein fugu_001441 [Takifugu bimaculatus]|uniref:SKI/SNO/DAC domain-containing protein n=1 Tax=Takifugu bimaculatus TaxID=433685 RepID=A0A4Z2CJM4_9TELE|nr:hypothetical protein fugu_001441 [Takifugu bimaculatus]